MERWTSTKVAGHVYRQVLAPAVFTRRGTTCWKEDFLRRSIDFYARRWVSPEERTIQVSLTHEWLGLPPPLTDHRFRAVYTGLEPDVLAPLAAEKDPPAELIASVSGPGLRYLNLGQSPQEFIDLLLEPANFRGTAYFPPMGAGAYFWCAAYGAVLVGDAKRLRDALQSASECEPPEGEDLARRYRQSEEGLFREIENAWRSIHSSGLPL